MKNAMDLVTAAKTRVAEVPVNEADAAIRDADVLIDVRRDGAMAVMPPGLVRAGLICSDIAVLAVAALIANWIRFGHPFAFDRPMLVMMIGLPIMILISEMVGIYRPQAASQPARGLLRWMKLSLYHIRHLHRHSLNLFWRVVS